MLFSHGNVSVIYFYEEYLYFTSIFTMTATFIGGAFFLWVSHNTLYKFGFLVLSFFSIVSTFHFTGLPLNYLMESIFLPKDISYKYWETLAFGISGVVVCSLYFIVNLLLNILKVINNKINT